MAPKRVIAEGDLVAVDSHYVDTPGDRGRAVLDVLTAAGPWRFAGRPRKPACTERTVRSAPGRTRNGHAWLSVAIDEYATALIGMNAWAAWWD